MASKQPGQNEREDRREEDPRVPGALQTQNIPNPRFSYAETPIQMNRPVFEQFSSPTNSTIEDSPLTPQQNIHHISASENTSPYPEDKPGPGRLNSPYNFPPPAEAHPANFAPFADYSSSTLISAPQQLDMISPRPHSSASTAQQHKEPDVKPHTIPRPPDPEIKPDQSPIGRPPRTPTYNPHSLVGPNVAAESHIPGQVSHPNSAVNPEWKHGMCEPDALCCVGIFCPCMVYGKTQYRLTQKAQKKEATDLLGYESMNGACGLMAVACGLQWILATIQRTRVRKIYHLDGSVGDDCIKSLCCCCCVLMQTEREIRSREELIRKHAGPASGPYVSPGTMTYAPPPR